MSVASLVFLNNKSEEAGLSLGQRVLLKSAIIALMTYGTNRNDMEAKEFARRYLKNVSCDQKVKAVFDQWVTWTETRTTNTQ
jgi:hypothetical protein